MIRVRRPFILAGKVAPSKSWLNRILILRSLHPDLQIFDWEPSDLDGNDVASLDRALRFFAVGGTEFDVGESGSGLRFLIARLSVAPGIYKIRASKKLMSRPHDQLFVTLKKLGTTVEQSDAETLNVVVNGWPEQTVSLEIDSSDSSQYASALLLASSVFKHEFVLKTKGSEVSFGYLDMTRQLVDSVKAGRKRFAAEPDASSVATLATIAVAASRVTRLEAARRLATQGIVTEELDLTRRLNGLEELVAKTLQPDRLIFDLLRQIRSTLGLCAIEVNLGSAPDLFPCVAALSVFSTNPGQNGKTVSRLFGAPHLRLKESDRIAGIVRLFRLCGISFKEFPDGIEINPISEELARDFERRRRDGIPFQFDPEEDHRLAFAAAVFAAGGIPIEVSNHFGLARGVVTKSFPTFWTMIEGDAPRIAMIGHRGAGKTRAARRWGTLLGARATVIDLDREIERLSGRSTRELFESAGEVEFRRTERQVWKEIDVETRNSVGAVIVSCGAGFDSRLVDDSWTRVWLRRATDGDGRVFTDRPRLNPDMDPLVESRTRFLEREPNYAESANRVFDIAEGAIDPSESAWVGDLFSHDIGEENEISRIGGCVTLMPGQKVPETCERLLRWGVARIEIRDDHWPPSSCSSAWGFFKTLPADRVLISFRNKSDEQLSSDHIESWVQTDLGPIIVDYPLGGDPMPTRLKKLAKSGRIGIVLSIHRPAAELSVEALEEIERSHTEFPKMVIKAALDTSDFKELKMFHEWMMRSCSTRAFLPTSEEGRWHWYRSWIGQRAPINFWREGHGSNLDQPTFSQWWRRHRFSGHRSNEFAAVLGRPVHHSRTPIEHDEFFRTRGMSVFSIDMKRNETATGLPLLIEMGLRAAAVTAPLKEEILGGRAINTLAVVKSGMTTTNTDNIGFKKLWSEASEVCERMRLPIASAGSGVVVWGGGGSLSSIADVLPRANFYSASKGKPRDVRPESSDLTLRDAPEIVIWASGSERGAWPIEWKPRLIVDLSYTEDSIGRVIAVETGARYVSGLSMFEAQAEAQREFWAELMT